MVFNLSRQLNGHEQDVKGVTHLSDNSPISVSRDGTVRQWCEDASAIILYNSATSGFVNAVEYISGFDVIALGGQEAIIYLILPNLPNQEPKYALVGHEGNVCNLHFLAAHNQLISSSWDGTARVWSMSDYSQVFELKGHNLPVWDAIVIGDKHFVTCGADKTIRIWEGNKEVQVLHGHTDVVRALVKIGPGLIASAANDGDIKIWDLRAADCVFTIKAHSLFIYDLAWNEEHRTLASSGEDRSVRLWAIPNIPDEPKVIQAITLPCVTAWCVDFIDSTGDLVVGSSDNAVRVFTSSRERMAPEPVLAQFKQNVEQSVIPEQALDEINRTDLPGYEVLDEPGKSEGVVVMVKSPAGLIEAHQWSAGVGWSKVGDVVGATKQGSKVQYNGADWDYVFDVDVEDGKPPLKLPYNVTENPYTAADKFLADNELPVSYREEVVRFIEKNTTGTELKQTAANESGNEVANDPWVSTKDPYYRKSRTSKEDKPTMARVIPLTEAIVFSDFKRDQVVKGLVKFNETAPEGAGVDVDAITKALDQPHVQGQTIVNSGLNIVKTWPLLLVLVGYDLLRIAIAFVPTCYAEVAKAIDDGLDNHQKLPPQAIMMIIKVLNNLANFSPIEFNLIEKVDAVFTGLDQSPKIFGTTCVAYATLLYTLSSGKKCNSVIDENAAGVIVESGSEAAYRLVISYGNSQHFGKADLTGRPKWVLQALDRYKSESRFQALAIEV